jgi:hypothetical protein
MDVNLANHLGVWLLLNSQTVRTWIAMCEVVVLELEQLGYELDNDPGGVELK